MSDESSLVKLLTERVDRLERILVDVVGELALNQDRLKERLKYDPLTGIFTHILPTGGVKLGSKAGTHISSGHMQIKIASKCYMAHQLAFLYMTGEVPRCVDHINGIRDDNRWENLRAVDFSENMKNRALQSNNKSGYSGVFFVKSSGKWRADIKANGRNISLGTFSTLEDAVEARRQGEAEYGYHRNHGKRINKYGLVDAARAKHRSGLSIDTARTQEKARD